MRNIKKVLRFHNNTVKLYSTWHRWSQKHEWQKRASDYDDYRDTEREKQNRLDDEQRREAYKKMLEKMTGIVDRKLDQLKSEDLSTSQTMDFLERTFELGSAIHRTDTGSDGIKATGQLQINFVDTFDGV